MKQDIRTGPGKGQRLTHAAFFAKYMDVRRNTLHGYNLGRPDTQVLPATDGERGWLGARRRV
jgi:hypothetical protein